MPRKYELFVSFSVLLIILGCTIGVVVPAGLGWDFANFYDAGRVIAAGELDLLFKTNKGLIAGAPPQGGLDFWGTPLSAYLYVPLTWFPPETALIIFKIENVLAYIAALVILYLHLLRFAGQDGVVQWQFAAMYAGLALLYQPFWTVFRVGGQTTATVLLLLCLALVSHSKLRFGWSSLLFVAVVVIKPVLATALVFLMIVSAGRFARLTVVYIATFGLVSIAAMGWDIHMEFMSKMLGNAGFTARWYFNSSIYTFISELQNWTAQQQNEVYSQAFFQIANLVMKISVIATFALIYVKTRNRLPTEETKAHFTFLLSVLFCLLISQTVWEHYLSFLFLPLAFLVVSYKHLDPQVRWMIIAIVSLPQVIQCFVNDFNSTDVGNFRILLNVCDEHLDCRPVLRNGHAQKRCHVRRKEAGMLRTRGIHDDIGFCNAGQKLLVWCDSDGPRLQSLMQIAILASRFKPLTWWFVNEIYFINVVAMIIINDIRFAGE